MFRKFTRKHLWEASVKELGAKVKTICFFHWIFRKFSEQSDKIVFKSGVSYKVSWGNLKTGILFIGELYSQYDNFFLSSVFRMN